MGIRDILKGSSEVTPKRANDPAPAKRAAAAAARAASGAGAESSDAAGKTSATGSKPAPAASASAPAGSSGSFGETSPAAGAGPPAPDIADAFQVLLAEELGEVPAGQFHAYTIHVTDDLIDRISLRVLDRLTKGSLNETMLRIVTEVSERLVREEIARIRASAEAR